MDIGIADGMTSACAEMEPGPLFERASTKAFQRCRGTMANRHQRPLSIRMLAPVVDGHNYFGLLFTHMLAPPIYAHIGACCFHTCWRLLSIHMLAPAFDAVEHLQRLAALGPRGPNARPLVDDPL